MAKTPGTQSVAANRALPKHIGRCVVAVFVLALCTARGISKPDQYTPVVVSPLTANTQPFLGTDGRQHVVYELVLTNASPTPATLQKLEVLDALNPSNVFATYEGSTLPLHLRTTGNTAVQSAEIEFNGTRLFLIDLEFSSQAALPRRLIHRFEVLGGSSPARTPATPAQLTYTVAPFDLRSGLPMIGPPLAGKGWVAANGCCGIAGVHRSSSLPVNGRIYFAQRFAIDWMRLDAGGRLVHGDPSDVKNYPCYGAEALAVADGTVVGMLDALDDQKPGTLPDPKTINVENVDGNHVVLDLGDGVFAFYAHLQKNSLRVAVGDRVKRGQVLGLVGNTGNTSAPHLHFHLMDGPSVLGSNGLPYVSDSFVLSGQVPIAKFDAAPGVEGDWSEGLLPTPSLRRSQFPMDLVIVDFPTRGDSAGHVGAKSSKSVVQKKP
jgi:hypothetical protein